MRSALSCALAAWFVLAAPVRAVELDLPGEAIRHIVAYTCSDGIDRSADYVSVGGNDLALLDLDGERRLFVAVIAASGVRYASGAHIWWTKGAEATLFDETRPDDEGIACRSKENAG